MSLAAGAGLMGLVVTAGVMEASTPGGIDEESVGAILVGLGILAMIGLLFLAFVLGVAALFQPHCKKVFAVLGVLLSGLAVAAVAALMAIGLAMET